jgi:hypothetical protein
MKRVSGWGVKRMRKQGWGLGKKKGRAGVIIAVSQNYQLLEIGRTVSFSVTLILDLRDDGMDGRIKIFVSS